jgi:phosphohistidine phosphatase
MRLYLVQHGHALPKEVDAERPLSERGRSDVERVAAFLGRAGIWTAAVVHSGKTRARQTAEILAAAVARPGCIEARSGIDPNDDAQPVAGEAGAWGEDVMLVGHLPFMGRLASRLCAQDDDAGVVGFEPGSVVCLERRTDGGWRLVWMIRPELFPDPGNVA